MKQKPNRPKNNVTLTYENSFYCSAISSFDMHTSCLVCLCGGEEESKCATGPPPPLWSYHTNVKNILQWMQPCNTGNVLSNWKSDFTSPDRFPILWRSSGGNQFKDKTHPKCGVCIKEICLFTPGRRGNQQWCFSAHCLWGTRLRCVGFASKCKSAACSVVTFRKLS